jgi:DNA helicase HerA-like ATPase
MNNKHLNMVSIKALEGKNESVGLGMIEITSVPSVKIQSDKYLDSQAMAIGYKKEMANLLTQIYQQMPPNNVSLELLWTTHAVANQPYKADIRLFLLVRFVGNNNNSIESNVNAILQTCKTSLDLLKYEYNDRISYEEIAAVVKGIDEQSICAVVKKEKVEESLQTFAFEQIPTSETDLSKIVNTLINYPDCAVSFQLIPVTYTPQEKQVVDNMTLQLDNMKGGQTNGNVSYSALVEKLADTYKYYSQNKGNALFKFNILIFGKTEAVQNIRSSIYGQLNAGLKFINLSTDEVNYKNSFYWYTWSVNDKNFTKESDPFKTNLGKLPYKITFEEAAEFFRLPFGNDQVSAGLKVNESEKTSRTYAQNLINAGDIEVGRLKSSSGGDKIGFSLKDLAKHLLIVGTPGSGKTTFSVSLLDRLWKQHNVPFLVIEPAKNEYRALIQSIPDLQVFTPGKNFISPFMFNPFVPPKNVKLETYKSTLKTAFAAAVSMTEVLTKIFEATINNCYSDFCWLDSYTVDDKGKIFNISDFIKCFEKTFEEIGYTGENLNIVKAGVLRLKSLLNLFDNYHSIPIEDLFEKPTIIELAAIENSDQKALIISLLLLSILAYVNANPKDAGKLHNVILLEEAHCLLDAETNAGEGAANPAKIAQDLVKRMLAEIRSAGVGLIIADQSPRKVGTDVVALTDMKMAFRLVEATDKQIIADSTSMSDVQMQRLAKLTPGGAFFFFNKLDEPEEVITPDYRLENKISISLSDEDIKKQSKYWNAKQKDLRPYPECERYSAYCKESCDYERRILAREIARRIFTHNLKSTTKNNDVVKKVFFNIENLVKKELNGEPFSKELIECVKVQLLRKIKYDTQVFKS